MTTPELSVVVGCPGPLGALRWAVGWIAAQTVANRIELVLVTPEPTSVDELGEALEAFAHVEVVAHPAGSAAAMNAAGVRAAGAPIVAFGEEHVFPEPGWAEALLARHAEGWTAVSPAVRNANPATLVSWCHFLVDYGSWMAPAEGGEREMLPGHNTSYRRDALLALGDGLEEGLEAEAVMQRELTPGAAGNLCVEPSAVIHHVNFGLWTFYLRAAYLNGRLFAGARCRGWGRGRRLLYGLSSGLIPGIRLVRILRLLDAPRRAELPFARVLPALVAGLTVDAAGQAVGYLRGPDPAVATDRAELEFERWRHVPPSDRLGLAARFAP